MANDGQIVFEVTADGKHAIANIKDITKVIQQETKKWDTAADQSTSNIDNSFSKLLKKLAAGFSAVKIGQFLLNIGKEAISAASDLEEVQNVVDVTFGDGASKIEAWAKNAGTQFGLTETQAKRFTSTMGAMMKSSGLAGEKIVDMSTDLAGLAADMASFYNLDFDTAFQKIRSGISGETEPLKQLGINMSVANLNAYALQKGLSKTFEQMNQGEQVMLRYQYMMDATADAQGDFARTSDGYANSLRKLETNVENLKGTLGKAFLNTVADAVGALNGFLEMLQPDESKKTVLDQFDEIDIDTTQKMADLEATYTKAQDIINLIEEISKQTVTLKDGSKVTFASLFADIGNVEKNGGDISEYIASLGLDVDYITQKYQVWREATKQLVKTVPELTSVIDDETGAIDGGTDALQKNLDEWRAYEEKKLAWAAYYAKERAVIEKKGSLYLYEFDAGAARQAVARARKALENIYNAEFDENGNVTGWKLKSGTADEVDKWTADLKHYNILLEQQREAEKQLENQTGALTEAEQQLSDGKAELIKKYGEEEKAAESAADASTKYAKLTADEWQTTMKTVADALDELEAHVKSVRDSVAQSVDSTVAGFEFIGNASQRQAKRMEPLEKELKDLKENGKELGDINIRIADAQDLYTITKMRDAMQSQLNFLTEYKQDMEKAQQMGFSNDFLAQFADGSVESAEWLHELTTSATDKQIQQLNDLYTEVEQSKYELTNTLTDQKLSIDEIYQTMADKAKEAVAALDLEGDAATNAGNTVAGLAQGISDHVPEVQSAVESILAQLDRLDSWGINVDLGGFGQISFTSNTGKTDGSHLSGLEYVPFDDYIARLHEGEAVLTAEENRVWQGLHNGGLANVDLDSLGGVMRDNIKPGGNVYLDGKVVGAVVSERQGRSYKSLQRSGWQS